VVTTVGPGVSNTVTGMMEAEAVAMPVIQIGGAGHCNVDLAYMRPYEKMVEMWGGHGEMVTDPGKIIPAIKRAAANGKPSFTNVEVDPEITIRHS